MVIDFNSITITPPEGGRKITRKKVAQVAHDTNEEVPLLDS